MKKILITGGAGFIGSHLVRLLVNKYPQYQIINLDKLTYAGNLTNLSDIEDRPNYTFVKADIADLGAIRTIFREQAVSDVIHLAAESHVDRSIEDPTAFVVTNVLGTVNLLISARDQWEGSGGHRFYHVSTDEVYGSLGEQGYFTETTAYDPRSPYSASKASSDHMARAFHHTYGLDILISNCSNNYGPNQFPEKLIPLIINNIIHERPLPVYGQGLNVRDWLWVGDHAAAIDLIFHRGKSGETYNIGGNAERKNIELVGLICDQMDRKLNRPQGTNRGLITYVTDRLGHDMRYAIDFSKLNKQLGWSPSLTLEEGMETTIDWYLANRDWLNKLTSGEYLQYYQKHYSNR
ncbi:MAG: dTDP-glucose 4,6-dehydratase [Saprospiraceae bacterium]|nr:dTDP-glucose 4,6-dehydratase [Saprospiraceae bacterium]HMW38018.1 dTDP-glucose 4,6-dehydratase [Saprospiraceae bacterium]HMX86980.1 dTDP-glucose 4,6-dehydratase [Saprospiraceae bacterium]HMZ39841.1 dTDP-glucose 4,6-dehydratase [Saprospiraceae bacterium]HNA64298.1 dTDP-glucose 4,6-dehydratase [Saprospiraceae bacterium]